MIAKALRKCFPLVKHSKGERNVTTWRHLKKKASSVDSRDIGVPGNQQSRQIADINTVEEILKSKGYLILSKSEHVITGLVPINYEVNDTRICIEISIDFVNIDDPVSVRFLGRQVPLDKVFQKLEFNIYSVVEISVFLEELKRVRPCFGYEIGTREEADYSWKNIADPNEIVTHCKRARTCKLLLCPSTSSHTCQNCRWRRYKSSKAVTEGEPNRAKEKPITSKDTDISLCEADNKDITDVIRYILDNNNMEFTEDQKLFIESQIKSAATKHSKQHRWQKRFDYFIL